MALEQQKGRPRPFDEQHGSK